MYRTKSFWSESEDSLSNQINDFLENETDIKLINVAFAIEPERDSGYARYCAIVAYEELME